MIEPNSYGLYILDVSHGNCSVVISEMGVMVIDAGPGTALLSFLSEMGIVKIDYFFLSHADSDHIGGLSTIIANRINVERVFLNSDAEKKTDVWDDLTYELDRNPEIKFKVGLQSDDEFKLGDLTLEVCAPRSYLVAKGVGSKDREGRKISHNSISAVILVKYQGIAQALLPGDLDKVGLDNWDGARAPVLIFPHHGGRPGNVPINDFVDELIQKTDPDIVVFSIDRKRFSLPKPVIVERLKVIKPSVYIACTQLSTHCAGTPPGSWSVSGIYAAGKEQGKSCAGTVFIHFGNIPNWKHKSNHQDFVAQVEKPICKFFAANEPSFHV